MKKYLLSISILVTSLMLCSYFTNAQEKTKSITLCNIEALSDDEQHTGGMIECHDPGQLYCPANKKSEYKIVMVYQ